MSNASNIVFRKSMNIGDQAAETDGFLSECFVETPEYKELANFSNNKMILLGRTGSGKTALLRKIKTSSDIAIEIDPKRFALEYILNSPFVSKLKSEEINLEAFYKFLWIHEIVSKIIRSSLYAEGEDLLIERIISFFSLNSKDNEKTRKLKNYFEKYDGVWFSETFPEKITTEMQSGIKSKLGISNISNMDCNLSESQKKEVQVEANSYVNKEQLSQLTNIIESLAGYFKVNIQKKIVVLIDDLDQDWVDEDSKYKLINALLTSIRSFSDIPNLKIIIALRADLHNKTCLMANRQIEKDESFTIKLHRDKNTLTELLDKRINHLFEKKYSSKQSVKFQDVFDCSIRNKKASDYILERSMMRPRDVINFVNVCITEADNSSKINETHIISAEETFRSERMVALSYEWKNVYKNLEHCLLSMNGFGSSFTKKELLNDFTEIENCILSAPSADNDYMQDVFSAPKATNEYKIQELIKALFKVGLLGKKAVDGSVHFSSTLRPDLRDIELINDSVWVIHSLFDMSSSIEEKQNKTDSAKLELVV